MKYILRSVIAAVVVVGAVLLAQPSPVGAVNLFEEGCKESSSAVCKEATGGNSANGLIQDVISTLIFVVGIIAVIMIIVGGIKYVTSNGDSSKVTSAKNTVLYSVIGLVVAILAFAIVNFVVAEFR